MKQLLTLILFISICAFIKPDSNNSAVFKQLTALEGTWKMETKNGAIIEKWEKVNNTYLQSTGYYINGNDTVITETVSLKNTPQGIFYTSTVTDQNNRQPVAFRFTKKQKNLFIFENSLHDFPKRIMYRFVAKDALQATIDDGVPGTSRKKVFNYKRIN